MGITSVARGHSEYTAGRSGSGSNSSLFHDVSSRLTSSAVASFMRLDQRLVKFWCTGPAREVEKGDDVRGERRRDDEREEDSAEGGGDETGLGDDDDDEDDVGDDDGTRETLGEFELRRRHRHRTHHVRTRRELDEWNQRVGQLNG